MKSMRIQNLRSLKDTGFIDLKPITLLLGGNSSGKSTFLRTFPLLKQSSEVRTMGPLLWNGRFVDFGSFEEAVSTGSDEITLQFMIGQRATSPDDFIYRYRSYRSASINLLEDSDFEITITVCLDKRRAFTILRRCVVAFTDNIIDICLNTEGVITTFEVNGTPFQSDRRLLSGGGGLVPHLFWRLEETRQASLVRKVSDRAPDFGLFGTEVIGLIQEYAHHKTSAAKIISMFCQLGIGSSRAMLERITSLPSATAT